MFDHVSIKVSDFEKSLTFYRATLAPLGYEAQSIDAAGKSAGFGPKGSPALWIAEGKPKTHVHLAFKSAGRAAVREFHAAALATGGKDNGEPGLRADYGDRYYAAFTLDPDGNNVEAVTFDAR